MLFRSSLRWDIRNDQGATVDSGIYGSDDVLAVVPATGTYTLKFSTQGNNLPASNTINFQLLDLIGTAAVATSGVDVTGTVVPGAAVSYQINGIAGDNLLYIPTNLGGLTGSWRIVSASGQLVGSVSKDLTQSGVQLNLPADGTYYVVWDTDVNATLLSASYNFNLKTIAAATALPLTLDSVTDGTLGEDSTLNYQFTVNGQSLLWLDALNNIAGMEWRILDEVGSIVAAGDFGSESFIRLGSAGTYTLSFAPQAGLPATNALSFTLSDLATVATSIATDTAITATLDPGNGVDIYRIAADKDDSFQFLSTGVAPVGVNWSLYSRNGVQVGSGVAGVDSPAFKLQNFGTGEYFLFIDGVADNTVPVDYSFNASLNRIPIGFNTTFSGTINSTKKMRYAFTLTQDTWLAFDTFKSTSIGYYYDAFVQWKLDGPNGEVFNQNMNYGNPRESIGLFRAGDYILTIYSNSYGTEDFNFQVLNVAATTAITPGTVVNGTLSPGNQIQLYQFDAIAGGSYSFKSLQNISAYWRLFDPDGQEVFDISQSTLENIELSKTGRYIFAVEGRNYDIYTRRSEEHTSELQSH